MELELLVSQNGDGDFLTIMEAVNAVPYRLPARIFVKSGIYHEKLFVEKQKLQILGEGTENTILSFGDYARQTHPDGKKYGTFRSYTAFLGGEHITVKNLTIKNTAGDGRSVGQAIAAYVDARQAYFDHVHLLGCQDTLFTAPLPFAPHIPGSFVGPREKAPRQNSQQYYKNCFIRGDIDFIFGGADAVFEDCTLFSNDRGETVNGYIAAPSTPKNGLGYLFLNCRLHSLAASGTVYLARPWRGYAKVAFLECEMYKHIAPDGWDYWGNAENEKSAQFAEYNSTGPGAERDRAFGRQLSADEAVKIYQIAKILKSSIT
ncbi:MAG TPA: pectinesterase family protein [Oscillospiraceae bacterium]|nr:pectinesterase family protein [Oscillospiraceae bacterium]